MPPVSPVSSVPPVYTPPTPEQITRAANSQLNNAPLANPALTVAAQAQPPIGPPDPQVFDSPAQPTIDVVQRSIAERAAEVQEAALLRDESIQALQEQLDPVTTPQDELNALENARLENGLETAQQLAEFNQAQVQLNTLGIAQNQLNALNNLQDQNALDPLTQDPLGANETGLQEQVLQTQQDLQAAQEARAEEQQEVSDREEAQRVEEQDAERIQEERAEAQRLQQERDAREIVEQQDAQRAEEVRVEAQEQADRIQAERAADQVVAEERTQAAEASRQERLEAQQARTDQAEQAQDARAQEQVRAETDRALAERALDAYRTQSERAAETLNAQSEATQPLNDQLQAARARLDALAETNIDRVDISNSALVGLAG